MQREIMQKLLQWKDRKDRKPLLLMGVRQCGKTYVLKEFGATAFSDVAYFNFDGNAGLASVFAYDLNPQRIINELGSVIRGNKIEIGKTLVIFDEIQACPAALTALKYFYEELPELHLVCAGSLLGVALKNEAISFPVGKINRMDMYPMSFKEFLLADGKEALVKGLEEFEAGKELPLLYTEPLQKELKYYYIVGGMPEAVQKWIQTQDFAEVDLVQEQILNDYAMDFGKHAPKAEFSKLGWIWDSLPVQLARENNKFIFSHVKAGKRAAELEDALQWLKYAGLIDTLHLVEKPELPLAFCADKTYFKVYMSDVGLLRKRSNLSPRTILEGDALYSKFKGALTENYVMNELVKQGITPYFWRSGNTAELDFLLEFNGQLIPMEAKAELNTRAKSYALFCKRYQPYTGFKCSMKNVGVNQVEKTKTYSLPLYLLWRLPSYLE